MQTSSSTDALLYLGCSVQRTGYERKEGIVEDTHIKGSQKTDID